MHQPACWIVFSVTTALLFIPALPQGPAAAETVALASPVGRSSPDSCLPQLPVIAPALLCSPVTLSGNPGRAACMVVNSRRDLLFQILLRRTLEPWALEALPDSEGLYL
ncbi:hypothetical protein E5288_WYG012264 [Bos mutus]|uniref:Uncharacterized protein n=1 Tax=Bos mutus TaxID=72004 RepID=A0A6B0RIU6_9CETA|nr:hypothetical protein [Bos mutus]